MTLTKKITINTLIHTIGKFSGSALGVVFVGILARYLGTDGFGHYTTIYAYLFFFSTLGDLGLYLITINKLGQEGVDQKKVFSNIFTMRLVSGLILMIIAGALIWLFPYPNLVKFGALIVAISVLLQMGDQILVALFQKEMKTKYPALAELVGKIIILGLAIWAVTAGWSFYAILWIVVIGLLIHSLINFFFARRLLSFSLAFDKKVWLDILKDSWPIATYMVFSMMYFKADTIILSLYHPASAVGLYGAPYKMLEVLITFPAIFMGLVTPHLSRAWSQKKMDDFKNIFQKAFDGLSMIIWPMIFGILALAQPIIKLIAGQDFLPAAPIMQILIVATGIIFIAHLSTFSVVAINKQRAMMKYYIWAAVSALALYFIFIPTYSYWAASLITLGVELFILIASWLMVRKEANLKINFKLSLKCFLSAFIMFLTLVSGDLNLLYSIIIGGLIYVVLIFMFGVLSKDLVKEFIGSGVKK